jgi:predicted nucleic acid-binding protein
MKPYVLDAHALMVYFEKEPGFDKIVKIFSQSLEHNNVFMTTVNAGEVIYIVLRECGDQKAAEIETLISRLPITIVPVSMDLARQAARFKAFKRMSYADCFSAALAKEIKARLVTGDKEFKEVEDEIAIEWL